MQPVAYRKRHGVASRGEREWRVEEQALVITSASGRTRRVPWKEIVSVRMYCEPAPRRPWRYVFELQPRHSGRIEIDNAHFLGARAYEERSDTYTPFVRAALAHLAAANPKARALMGETPKRYFFLLLTALVGFCAVALAMIAVRTPLDALPFAAPAKLGVVLLTIPLFWAWVIRAMPRGVPLDQVPDRVFPPASCGAARAHPPEVAPSALP